MGTPPWLFRALAALAILATILGAGVAPALPGTKAGIDPWIVWTDWLAGFTSQLFAIGAALVLVRLLVALGQTTQLGLGYRLCAVPATVITSALVIAAARAALDSGTALALAIAVNIILLSGAPLCLWNPRTRALGLTLGLVGVSALIHLFARALALRASEQALSAPFFTARVMATVSVGLSVAAMLVAAVWLARASSRWHVVAVTSTAILFAAVAVGLVALGGSGYPASVTEVLVGRALGEMTRHPSPLLWPLAQYTIQVLALLFAAVIVFSRRTAGWQESCFALLILARGSADIPAFALCLALAGIAGPLYAMHSKN
jgi:hypothetical protein